MALLTETEQKRISEAVARAEARTGGEIVTAIIPESDDYGFNELLFAVIIGVLTFLLIFALHDPLERLMQRLFWTYEPWYFMLLLGVLPLIKGGGAYFYAQVPFVDRFIVPRARMAEAVARRARRHFMEAGVYDTVDRTGILIFVSQLERRVELIADRGIDEKVAPGAWDAIVSSLTRGIADGRTVEAMIEAIDRCGDILEGNVIRRTDDTNELDNRTTELESGS